MDLTATIVPKSDQLNAEDLLAGPVTVTVESVTGGSAEQPVNVNLREFPGRPYRPSKTQRRVLVKLWGAESSAYTGRRMTLYRDPEVKFGGIKVGGIKISHLSHIEKRATLVLTETKGKRAPHVVEPLPDAAPTPSATLSAHEIATSTDVAWLRETWKVAGPEQRARIQARVAELTEGGAA
ncbi:hypothetical protein [Cellulomonas denverensis]|uniref:Uncharacterized protein n=1 Tax=Cellulomonas denverensis TaxID=264297 RepID=A0A7X6KU50_9CELL|nr:hypothetical protein [Cellulomonas denverensis]NKY22188.1 hypothetical protein [Cellulomonas denverensis]GIG27151.1 hypothetical protein Cde04nite_33950 [Cellulomonas denverensis]